MAQNEFQFANEENLKRLLIIFFSVLSVFFMIFGGALPYVFQYLEIYQRKSADGFSLLVCLALFVANILRIMFWFGKRFETPLLAQSGVMIVCMIMMLEISVRMNQEAAPTSRRTSIWEGDFFDSFWTWHDLSSYIFALVLFTILSAMVTAIFSKYKVYVEVLGMVALFVEACLGIPQLVQNFARKSISGMSVKMVLMWLIGDVGKTIYFVLKSSPSQFYICSGLQIAIDVLILLQVFFYARQTPSEIPTFVSNPNLVL